MTNSRGPLVVIFDVDGTLIDSVDLHAQCWQEALNHFGKNFPLQEIREQIGKGSDQLLPHFLSDEEVKKMGEELTEYRKNLYMNMFLSKVRPFPQVRELFDRIHDAGLKTALATSSSKEELTHNKRLVNIEDAVDAESTADDAEKSKPHPDIFQAVLERLGSIAPERTIAVGDTPYDAEAAGKAGIPTIGFRSGGFPEESLRKAGCVAIYDGPADLLRHFEESPIVKH